MKAPNPLVLLALAVLLVIVGAGAGYAAASMNNDDPESDVAGDAPEAEGQEWLYVLLAGEGSLEPSGEGFELQLTDVHEQAVAFTDRPDRVSAHMDLDALLGLWDEGGTFSEDPPNAELEIAMEDGSKELVTLELLSVDAGDVVTFQSVVVPGAGSPEIDSAEFSAATLFIDSVTFPPTCATFQSADMLACQRGYYEGYLQGSEGIDSDAYGSKYCSTQGSGSLACLAGWRLGYATGENAN